MWKQEVTIETEATKEQIWELWSDVENWNKWDDEVLKSELNGEFINGAKGILKPTNGPKSKFILESVKYPIEFTTKSSLPLATMYFTHRISEKNGKRQIIHGVEIKGLTTFIFSKVIGKKNVSELPKALKKLSLRAKK